MKKLSFIRLLLPVLLVGLALVSCQDNECCDDMGIKEYDMSKSICVNMDGQDYVLLSSSKAAKELFGEDAGSLSEIDFQDITSFMCKTHLQIQSLGFRVIGRMVTMMLPYF